MSPKAAPPRPIPRIYLATPVVDDPSQLVAGLPALLAAADVAAVLVRLSASDPRTLISHIKALAHLVERLGSVIGLVCVANADGAQDLHDQQPHVVVVVHHQDRRSVHGC
jgi:thiamine-phosphate pyrophosphorylase